MLKAGIYDPYLDTLGGGERYVLTVAEILLNQGHQVDLFWNGNRDLISKAENRFSLDLTNLNIVKDIFGVTNQVFRTSIVNKFNTTRQYDLFFYLSDGSLPFIFSKRNFLHVQVPFNFKFTLTNKFLNLIKISLFKNIICNSRFTAKFINKLYLKQSVVLYPPVDLDKFKPGNKQNIILSVGRFDNILNAKRQDVLIDAFAILSKTNPTWKLVLAGGSLENPDKNNYLIHLKTLAKNLPIEFVVNPPFSELQSLYSESKIFWHATGFEVNQSINPEKTEHFGIVVVEAMASGLVPLLVNRGGLPEIVTDNQNGFLWEDINTLVSKTNLLIHSPQTLSEFSQNALKSVDRFSKAEFSQQFLKLLKL